MNLLIRLASHPTWAVVRSPGQDVTTTTLPAGLSPGLADPVDFSVGSVLGALGLACLAAVPIAISVWALLDVAHRPRWAWALAGRRQVMWMAIIMVGIFSVIGGLLISAYYLRRVRPFIADAEAGRL